MAVADFGKGIPAVERSRVFEKYYRIGSTGEKQVKGTGLGLYIAKRIAELLNAQIFIEENKPVGSVFKVLFNLNNVS